MERTKEKIIRIAGISVLVAAALYIGLSVYYTGKFPCGIWVNGVYCTGKTVAQANEELLSGESPGSITLLLPRQGKETIALQEIGCQMDYSGQLEQLQTLKKPWLWPMGFLEGSAEYQILPEISLDEAKFTAVFDGLDFVKGRKEDNACRVFIEKTEDGYTLVNERESVLDYDICKAAVKKAILRGESDCDLEAAGCYISLPLTQEMRSVLRTWERLEDFLDCGIVYQFGEESVAVTPADVSEWIVISDGKFAEDENGSFQIDREKLDAYVDALADRYDTAGGTHVFLTTRGDTVSITGGTYGNLLDREAEKDYLYQAFLEGIRETHEPSYLQEAAKKGGDDIGGTYIEVDMGNQMLYYYEDNTLMLDTPIVTGDMMKKRDTPAMVCFVYAKQRNRTLKGRSYAAHVDYWMPVRGGIGIHDAQWRQEFGGDIYKTEGSHGCINTPIEAMERLYELTEVGTPVVMFY